MRGFDKLTDAERIALLADPDWRIRNLYHIRNKYGETVIFHPNDAQEEFMRKLWFRNLIPKARQRGFSTLVQLMILDACLFVLNTKAAIIAQDLELARAIRDDKIMFAYDRLPDFVLRNVPLVVDNAKRLEWKNGSEMIIGTTARGRTLSWLHVSEYGEICAKNPEHAKEIQSGALPAAEYGTIIIEATAQGADGDFTTKVMQAKAVAESGRQLTRKDYRLHFASWWDAPEYEVEDPEHITISPKDHAYFDRMEGLIGREISLNKRAWYVQQRDVEFSGDQEMMWSQFPTTLEEAFQQSTEGKFLADQLSLARRQGRIGVFKHDPSKPVYTFWDIGTDDDTAIWFMQINGNMFHFVDFYECNGEAPAFYAREVLSKPYNYAAHYLPHDGAHRRIGTFSLDTYADMLAELGLRNIEIVPVTPDKVLAINLLRTEFSRYVFDEENCKNGINHLEKYQKQWNARHGVWTSYPAQNGHQHAADAIMQKAQLGDAIFANKQQRPNRARRGGMAV